MRISSRCAKSTRPAAAGPPRAVLRHFRKRFGGGFTLLHFFAFAQVYEDRDALAAHARPLESHHVTGATVTFVQGTVFTVRNGPRHCDSVVAVARGADARGRRAGAGDRRPQQEDGGAVPLCQHARGDARLAPGAGPRAPPSTPAPLPHQLLRRTAASAGLAEC